ncbi:MAG: AAA family ATPase, partial [Myxococcota bacterium]
MAVAIDMAVFVTVDRDRGAASKYRVQSLFLPRHRGAGPTFQRALRTCAKITARAYRGHVPDRASMAQLGWLAFDPAMVVETVELDLPATGGGLMPVGLTIGRFEAGGQAWAVVPRLDGHVVALPDARYPEQIEHLARDLSREIRDLRRAMHPDRVDLSTFAAQKGDFLTSVTVHLDVRQGRFAFDPFFSGDTRAGVAVEGRFVGAEELPRVATNLADRYPEQLHRTLDPDPRVDDLHQALYTERRAAIALLGPPGAGRTTLLHEAVAQRLEEHDRQGGRLQKVPQVWHLDPTRIIAGMALVGAWQRRSQAILRHLRDRLRKTYDSELADVLFIDNPVALCRIGRHAGGSLTLSTLMRPFIERRQITVVLEASPTEWQRLEELDRPFADLFRVVRVPPPPRRDALRYLIARRDVVERATGCTVTRPALRRLVEIDTRYPGARAAPGSLVDRLAQLADQHPQATLEESHVETAFLGRSGMRPEMVDPARALVDDQLREELRRRLIGQPDAIDALSDAIHLLRAGLVVPGRPAGSLLLVGPTGVGKTETAKVLADYVYESDGALVRFDMNEYVDGRAVSRLIGDGMSTDGQLTGRVRYRPFCVLLLDEIEKAHPSVHDLLLQLLDEGRLTDAFGHAVDFTQCVVVMTSNVGAREALRRLGFDDDAAGLAATYRSALGRAFRPEFLNRIDRVVVFERLDEGSVQAIAKLQIGRLLRREGLLRRTLVVRLAPSVLPWVAKLGFDPDLGARALKRALERRLIGPVAGAVVEVPVEQPTSLTVSVHNDVLRVDVEPLAARAPPPP